MLDRIVTLHLAAAGARNEHGEWEPGEVRDVRIWAELADGGSIDVETRGGVARLLRLIVNLRWRRDLAEIPPDRLALTDDRGRRFNVESVTDHTIARQRLVTLAVVQEVS